MHKQIIAGINIGSVSVSIVLLDEQEEILCKDYSTHNGNVYDTLRNILSNLPVKSISGLGVVAERGREFFKEGFEVNEQVAIIEGVKRMIPDVGSIIYIGGENFGLILLDNEGRYKKYISNSACAAGTGSFLDQQAHRLGLNNSEELSIISENYNNDPPKIATRCAVFAKTDLIHIQQQGYGLPAIAAGLAKGVAHNICDTLFHGIELLEPVVVVGGVSKNKKVVHYLQELLQHKILTPLDREYVGAIGAALIVSREQRDGDKIHPFLVKNLLIKTKNTKTYFYAPLSETKSDIPDFSSWKSFVLNDVEVDIYKPLIPHASIKCLAGFDIGSTSTKATLVTPEKEVVLGLYTKTNSQPILAMQKLTKTIQDIEHQFELKFEIVSSGTTGSGRKFIQKIINADYAVDEITAHACAAYHLNPEIDTIIEIGGQDSKFTVLKDGNVTFSVMNYVCAAGTGSFIEEQARRLKVALCDYSKRAILTSAPLISDRCTVFMERDLNHLLSMGYSIDELLATAVHSVRDNYLSKVAHINKIGKHITFQGATAKNYALVKAFEQKLKKSIYVSRFCHLTGAIGVCLKMMDASVSSKTLFRKDLHHDQIVTNEYICGYCNNNCKIQSITIDESTIGWGYLCGRDEQSLEYKKKAIKEFDLLRNHRKIFDLTVKSDTSKIKPHINIFKEFKKGGIRSIIRKPNISISQLRNRIQFNGIELRNAVYAAGVIPSKKKIFQKELSTIGLPMTLTMLEYLPFWKLLFERLGFKVVISSPRSENILQGKKIRQAEFCAPLTEFHGHMQYLNSKTDYIFFPQIFENISDKEKKSYCYYSIYAVPLIKNLRGINISDKLIAPVLKPHTNIDTMIHDVYVSFPNKIKNQLPFKRFDEAYHLAWSWYQERKNDLKEMFRDQKGASNDIGVVLMGRPYLILNSSLNKGTPDKLAEMGIQTFFMDMVPLEEEKLNIARNFSAINHWHYGNMIIKAAEIIAQTEGIFPIFMTAFKCAPDAFIISYFKKIMDYYGKPYLILQCDEHEAVEGYDTRIEAAIETFRNFPGSVKKENLPEIRFIKKFGSKTYLLPQTDNLSGRLIQGAYLHAGIKTLLVEQTPQTLQRCLHINDGQCLPVSALTQGIIYTIDKQQLKPEETVIICNSDAQVSCNFPQYPIMIKQTLNELGNGMEKVDVLVSRFLPTDMSVELLYEVYIAYLLSGLIQKISHKLRPREKVIGQTDNVYRKAGQILFECFAKGKSKEEAFQTIINDFCKIQINDTVLPQVGIIGDIYVRDNEIFNQNLATYIENAHAEVIAVPFYEALELIANKYFRWQWAEGRYLDLFRDSFAYNTVTMFSNKMAAIAKPLFPEKFGTLKKDPTTYLNKNGITISHGGETTENLLKIYYLYENYPHLKLIINVNPIFCCPGLISEAIYKKIEDDIKIPIISITYDGSTVNKNKILEPYLHFLK